MVNGAIGGMVSALDDPYTVFLPPKENKVNKENLNGVFGGVGIRLGYKDGILAVIAPLEGSPASEKDVKAGDLILNVKDDKKEIDEPTTDMSLPEAVQFIRGEMGTFVTLTLRREGKGTFDVDLERREITIPSLESKWLEEDDKDIAYVHLIQFSGQIEDDWSKWVQETKSNESLDGVVLDLRNNPGGYLQAAVFVAEDLLPKNSLVVYQKNYKNEKIKYEVTRQGNLLDVPLVVLVNQGSASASEILAGALKDYERAKIVGTQTFGKGTVQEPEILSDGSGLHITVAKWLLPLGSTIQKEGLTPDVVVEFPEDEEELKKLVEEERDIVLERGINVLLGN